ncbi:hypothetical protein [Paenibacillus glucanolyticus]|uniref:hypothetical protein n=1 Tax=Paenibacillus glucanolyticus TaxID=59843 RepID=UPI00096C7ECA|nr:hypothetical protein [Paenibacillus glucanolyticus]OMF76685.1 hypothetical protein BK142_14280 [Paenibacillus glucanolyticus]
MQTAFLNGRTIEVYSKNSPDFENEMDPIEFMEKLDRMYHELNQNPTDKTAQFIREELQSFQVITINNVQNGIRWITSPMTYVRRKMQRSTIRRIFHLFKTGTQWASKYVQYSKIEGEDSLPIPISLSVQLSLHNLSESNNIDKLKCSITALKETIYERLQSGKTTIGIFESPDGVVNMNLLNAWLDENKPLDGTRWTNNNTLTVVGLDQVVDSILFQPEMTV